MLLSPSQMDGSILHSLGHEPLRGWKPKVGIIGAGLSGLALGFELHRLGFEVAIFEARHRTGGRARTYRESGSPRWIEAGGEFIGESHWHWQCYAKLFGKKLRPVEAYSGPVSPILPVPNGRFVSNGEAQRLAAEMVETMARISKDAEPILIDRPWESQNAAALDAMSVGDVLRASELSARCYRALTTQFEANQGVSVDRISYLGLLVLVKAHGGQRFWTDTENYRCDGGVQGLAAAFHEVLGDRVHLGAPVTGVTRGSTHLEVLIRNGTRVSCDEVVVAAPVSIWPKLGIEGLDEDLIPQMGLSVKFLLEVDREFPVNWGLNPLAVDDSGLLQLIWETTAGQHCERKVLTGFSGGSAAEKLCGLSREELTQRCMEELEQLMPGIGRHARTSRFKAWPKSEFSRGGYSCPAPGEVTGKWPKLWDTQDRIWFAGEACSPYWSFMNGGLESAVRIARQLHSRYQEQRRAVAGV